MHLRRLNEFLVALVFEHLPPKDILVLRTTCKAFWEASLYVNSILISHTLPMNYILQDRLWQQHYEKIFKGLDDKLLLEVIPKEDIKNKESRRWFYLFWSAWKWTTGINLLNKYVFLAGSNIIFKILKLNNTQINAMYVKVISFYGEIRCNIPFRTILFIV